jgi:hypothetical protein
MADHQHDEYSRRASALHEMKSLCQGVCISGETKNAAGLQCTNANGSSDRASNEIKSSLP